MTFPIDVNIPNANNYPGDDQPGMQTNFSNINSYLQVDHTNPASAGAGEHEQVTFNNKNVPGVQTEPISTLYTDNGVAEPTKSQLKYRNELGIFPVSLIRAYVLCDGTVADGAGAILNSQSVNVTSVKKNSTGNYTIVLDSNAVSSDDFGILISYLKSNPNLFYAYSAVNWLAGVGSFNVKFRDSLSDVSPTEFTVQVLQI